MKTLFRKLLRRELYDQIPKDDLMARQRFSLFRIYSFSGFIASIVSAIQVFATFAETSFLSLILIILAVIIIANYLQVNKIEKLPKAYLISLVAVFFVIHVQSYNAGGIMNTGTMYLRVMLTASMAVKKQSSTLAGASTTRGESP